MSNDKVKVFIIKNRETITDYVWTGGRAGEKVARYSIMTGGQKCIPNYSGIFASN
jgi:hypothetical protein